MYHDPGKYPPMTIKCEFSDCSSAEEEENSDSNDNQDDLLTMSAPPIQSRKKECVKGQHICHLCGKDFVNKSDLNSHLMAHAGVTFKGPFSCPKCKKDFPLHTTMQNHIKTHTKQPYTFDCCQWETKSYVLSLEHKK